MNSMLISLVVIIALYVVIIFGLFCLFRNNIRNIQLFIKTRKRLYINKDRQDSDLYKHLRHLFNVTLKLDFSPALFLCLSVIIFLVALYVSTKSAGVLMGITIAVILSIMPYILLRAKLEKQRRRISHEGESLMLSFLNKYRILDRNICETLEDLIKNETGLKMSKRILYSLLISLRNSGSDQDISESAYRLSYSIDTSWSKMFAHNIKIGMIEGIDISGSVEDILVQLREARTLAEERKRLNGEAVRIVLFMIPVLYIGSLFAAVKYLGLNISELMGNQFSDPSGFAMFVLILFLFLINISIIEIVMNKRLDY